MSKELADMLTDSDWEHLGRTNAKSLRMASGWPGLILNQRGIEE